MAASLVVVGRTTATYSGGLAGIKPPEVEHAAGLFCEDMAQCFLNGMNILKVRSVTVFATDVRFDEDMLRIQLSDGREIGVPLEQFPRLRDATDEQRANWRLIGKGVGIHWEDIDEDLISSGIIGILNSPLSRVLCLESFNIEGILSDGMERGYTQVSRISASYR